MSCCAGHLPSRNIDADVDSSFLCDDSAQIVSYSAVDREANLFNNSIQTVSHSAVDKKTSFKMDVTFELLSSLAEINDRDTAAQATQAAPLFPHLPASIRLHTRLQNRVAFEGC